jgi:hypothetical protein
VKFSSAEQYLEKTAGLMDVIRKLFGGAGAEAAGNIGKFEASVAGAKPGVTVGMGGKLLDWMGNHPGTTLAGVGGLGAIGALGGFKTMEGANPGETYSYRINKNLNDLLDRIRYDEVASESFAKEMGSQSAEALMGLATDMTAKGVEALKSVTMDSPARAMIFNALKREDPIIGQADTKTLNDAFHTMANIAPTLSTDKNAVKSVLRLAATSGGGLDYQTIKGLADAEMSLRRARGPLK